MLIMGISQPGEEPGETGRSQGELGGAGGSREEHPWKVVPAFRIDSSRSSSFLGLEWIPDRQWAGLL